MLPPSCGRISKAFSSGSTRPDLLIVGHAAGSEAADDRSTAEIPLELLARLARPTVRLSGSIDEAAAAAFLSQVLPVLDVPGRLSSSYSAQAEMPKWDGD
jgi:hypothetical protein